MPLPEESAIRGDGVIAVDIGGTKIAAAVADDRGDRVAGPFTLPSGRETDAQTLCDRVVELIDRCRAAGGGTRIGVSACGPFSTPGRLSPINLPAWRDYPLLDRLRAAYPRSRIRLANDGVSMALAEHWRGAARSARSSIGIVTSTGVGGGVIVDGRPLLGATGNAGHLGHLIVEPGGRPCPCGARGCLETVASGTAACAFALEQGWSPDGEPDGRALAADARRGVAPALAAFQRAARGLADGIIGAVALVDAQLVTIGGGFAGSGDLLFEPLRAAIGERAGLEFVRRVPVVPARLGSDASLVGAAALFLAARR